MNYLIFGHPNVAEIILCSVTPHYSFRRLLTAGVSCSHLLAFPVCTVLASALVSSATLRSVASDSVSGRYLTASQLLVLALPPYLLACLFFILSTLPSLRRYLPYARTTSIVIVSATAFSRQKYALSH